MRVYEKRSATGKLYGAMLVLMYVQSLVAEGCSVSCPPQVSMALADLGKCFKLRLHVSSFSNLMHTNPSFSNIVSLPTLKQRCHGKHFKSCPAPSIMSSGGSIY
jgi:hypothetical protein